MSVFVWKTHFWWRHIWRHLHVTILKCWDKFSNILIHWSTKMILAKNYRTVTKFVKVMPRILWPLFSRTRCSCNGIWETTQQTQRTFAFANFYGHWCNGFWPLGTGGAGIGQPGLCPSSYRSLAQLAQALPELPDYQNEHFYCITDTENIIIDLCRTT